jgi:hypothetical protein
VPVGLGFGNPYPRLSSRIRFRPDSPTSKESSKSLQKPLDVTALDVTALEVAVGGSEHSAHDLTLARLKGHDRLNHRLMVFMGQTHWD